MKTLPLKQSFGSGSGSEFHWVSGSGSRQAKIGRNGKKEEISCLKSLNIPRRGLRRRYDGFWSKNFPIIICRNFVIINLGLDPE
jgi:hypothetical protein